MGFPYKLAFRLSSVVRFHFMAPPRHHAAPGNPVRVMDCAGKAPAATALSPARASRELLQTGARTKAASCSASRRPPLLDPHPDRGCVADQPQRSAGMTASEIFNRLEGPTRCG